MASIKELSERIARNSTIVEEWLAKKNARMPSFEQDAEDEFPDTDGEPNIEMARMAVIDDTSALHDLLLGPREVMARVWGAVGNHEIDKTWLAKHMPSLSTMQLSNASTTSTFYQQFHSRAAPPMRKFPPKSGCLRGRLRLLCGKQPFTVSCERMSLIMLFTLPPQHCFCGIIT